MSVMGFIWWKGVEEKEERCVDDGDCLAVAV